MLKKLNLLMLSLLNLIPVTPLQLPAQTNTATTFSYTSYDDLLQRFVNERGQVDYAGLKRDFADLQKVVDLFASVSPENKPELFPAVDERKRYYLTAYNAWVLYHGAKSYPDKHALWSRLGFFKNKPIILGGKQLSLNELEHEIIRKKFLDPRIHFYLNCGANSCPPLKTRSIAQNATEPALEEAARQFITNTNNVKFDAASNTLQLSKIFDWFEKDFLQYLQTKRGLEKPHIAQYIGLYLNNASGDALRKTPLDQIKIKYLDYDKSINSQ